MNWHTLYSLVFAAVSLKSNGIIAPSSTHSGVENAVIIQMFQWDWDSIGEECTDLIGPAGYGFVQVNPPAEHIQGLDWWTDYQPVSYNIASKHGNRTQFKWMVDKCHATGVKVITDTLFNHMSAVQGPSTGTAGSAFTKHDYPGLYSYDDFHHNCGTPNNIIIDFNNRYQLQNCELLGLADLDTRSDYVQARLVEYANDLRSLGADGFRIDAAKHIPANELEAILLQVPGFRSTSLYITQEVFGGTQPGEEVRATEYLGNGDVHVFEYANEIKAAFISGGIASLKDLDSRGWIPSASANVFVVNHDGERLDKSLTAHSPSNTYTLGLVFSLAYPYGRVSVLSSYDSGIEDHDVGPPDGGRAKCIGTGQDTDANRGWLCQHRWTAVAGMTRFRNAVRSTQLENWQSPQRDRIAFSRGNAGFVVINNSDSPWNATLITGLPKGRVEVGADGNVTIEIHGRSAIGIHVRET
ncbi:Alpha-amylase [Pleurotus pulmonarius]